MSSFLQDCACKFWNVSPKPEKNLRKKCIRAGAHREVRPRILRRTRWCVLGNVRVFLLLGQLRKLQKHLFKWVNALVGTLHLLIFKKEIFASRRTPAGRWILALVFQLLICETPIYKGIFKGESHIWQVYFWKSHDNIYYSGRGNEGYICSRELGQTWNFS